MARLALALIFFAGAVLCQVFAEDAEQIVGGSDAYLGQFRYQVSLRLRGGHFCGGTLITTRHVVTAAHCIQGVVSAPFNDFVVVSGTISLSSGGYSHRVANAITHPDFIPSAAESYKNDVAVVILAESVNINRFQGPIALTKGDPPVGAVLTLSGWGRTVSNGPLPNILQTTNVYLMSNAECQQKAPNTPIHDGQLCTIRQKGIGACQGDSGGPLVYQNKLVGIVSWVFPCAQGLPDGFTRVSKYEHFINDIVSRT